MTVPRKRVFNNEKLKFFVFFDERGINLQDVNLQPSITFLLLDPEEYEELEASRREFSWLPKHAVALPMVEDPVIMLKEIFSETRIHEIKSIDRGGYIDVVLELDSKTRAGFFKNYKKYLEDIKNFLAEFHDKEIHLAIK